MSDKRAKDIRDDAAWELAGEICSKFAYGTAGVRNVIARMLTRYKREAIRPTARRGVQSLEREAERG